MKEEIQRELARQALLAREQSYVPYSEFAVGAALLGNNGMIYEGCNVENAAYGLCNCAERTAFFKAVSNGALYFEGIAIAGGKKGAEPVDYCPPCGSCRQVMAEFCGPDFKILLVKAEDDINIFTLAELLPCVFSGCDLVD